MPSVPGSAYIDMKPDWVCKILSPTTRAKDVGPKCEVYARIGVGHLWYVDPPALTRENFELRDGRWILGPAFRNAEPVRSAPLADVAFTVDALWPGRASDLSI